MCRHIERFICKYSEEEKLGNEAKLKEDRIMEGTHKGAPPNHVPKARSRNRPGEWGGGRIGGWRREKVKGRWTKAR